jgi:hypothetical protein
MRDLKFLLVGVLFIIVCWGKGHVTNVVVTLAEKTRAPSHIVAQQNKEQRVNNLKSGGAS